MIRTICLVLCLVVAVDLGWNGCHANYNAYATAANAGVRQLVMAGIFGLCALVALVGGLVAVGFRPKSVDFLIEVEQEMIRVTWPTTTELIRSTIFIAIMIVVLAGAILGVDGLNLGFLHLILGDKG